MNERYDNLIYMERGRALITAKIPESDVHEVLRSIKFFEQNAYYRNERLKKSMKILEDNGHVLDIYNNMSEKERIVPLLTYGISESKASEMSNTLHIAENHVIHQFETENPNLKEQRAFTIEEAGRYLQELNAHTIDTGDIGGKIEKLQKHMSTEQASRHYIDGILAIPISKESPARSIAQHFQRCRIELAMGGMPDVIADARIVETAITIEQNRFADAVADIVNNEPKFAI